MRTDTHEEISLFMFEVCLTFLSLAHSTSFCLCLCRCSFRVQNDFALVGNNFWYANSFQFPLELTPSSAPPFAIGRSPWKEIAYLCFMHFLPSSRVPN